MIVAVPSDAPVIVNAPEPDGETVRIFEFDENAEKVPVYPDSLGASERVSCRPSGAVDSVPNKIGETEIGTEIELPFASLTVTVVTPYFNACAVNGPGPDVGAIDITLGDELVAVNVPA